MNIAKSPSDIPLEALQKLKGLKDERLECVSICVKPKVVFYDDLLFARQLTKGSALGPVVLVFICPNISTALKTFWDRLMQSCLVISYPFYQSQVFVHRSGGFNYYAKELLNGKAVSLDFPPWMIIPGSVPRTVFSVRLVVAHSVTWTTTV